SQQVAFFERAELTSTPDGDEILPTEYTDNYVTVFPGETVEIQGQPWSGVSANWVRVTGYNTAPVVVSISQPQRSCPSRTRRSRRRWRGRCPLGPPRTAYPCAGSARRHAPVRP